MRRGAGPPTDGAALLGGAAGLVVAAPTAGAILRRVGVRPVMACGLALFTGGLVLIARASSAVELFAVLVVWGFGAGLVDVAMNTEAVALQARAGRSIMSRLHAGWSIGGLAGAGLGAVAAGSGLSLGTHFDLAAAVVAAGGALAVWSLDGPAPPTRPARGRRSAPGGRRVPATLLALGAVAFGDFLAEGATNDWSAVYLHGSLGASPGVAALGFTTFALAMAAGRLAGDHLVAALGPVRLVRGAAAVAASGMVAGLVVGRPVVALVGFGLLGAGLSVVVPVVFSAAATFGVAGTSVATVTGCGYVGLVLGPPLIGGLAEVAGLRAALTVVVLAAGASVVLAGGGPADRVAAVTWLLCDYGEVLCLPQPAADLTRMQMLCGMDAPTFAAAYWAPREAYDRGGLDAAGFWTAVLGTDPAERLDALVAADIAGWLHLDPASLSGVQRAVGRGLRPAILSNAPREIGVVIDALPELATYGPRMFSWALGVVKPDPAVYHLALAELGAQPSEVTFVDDRPDNVAAARALGIDAVVYRGPATWDGITPDGG